MDPGRKLCSDEIAILKAIESGSFKPLEHDVGVWADVSFMSFYGYLEILAPKSWQPFDGLDQPGVSLRLTDMGREALKP